MKTASLPDIIIQEQIIWISRRKELNLTQKELADKPGIMG